MDIINQINCFLKVDMLKHGLTEKDMIKLPADIRVNKLNLLLTQSDNLSKEYKDFANSCIQYMKTNGLWQDHYFDYYRLIGGSKLTEES